MQEIVHEHDLDLLVLCGQAAEHCVVFTYNGARDRGHTAVILQNAVLSRNPGRVEALMVDRNVISYPDIETIVSGGRQGA